jgi:hypothetical protein
MANMKASENTRSSWFSILAQHLSHFESLVKEDEYASLEESERIYGRIQGFYTVEVKNSCMSASPYQLACVVLYRKCSTQQLTNYPIIDLRKPLMFDHCNSHTFEPQACPPLRTNSHLSFINVKHIEACVGIAPICVQPRPSAPTDTEDEKEGKECEKYKHCILSLD